MGKRKPQKADGVGAPSPEEDDPLAETRTGIVGKLALTRRPEVFAQGLPPKGNRWRALGIDFGVNCGVAYCDVGSDITEQMNIIMCQWNLSTGPVETGTMRLLRLQKFLEVTKPDVILCEDVKNTPSTQSITRFNIGSIIARAAAAAEFLGTLKWQAATWAEQNNVHLEGVPIATIKKYATGMGNASKVDMIHACNRDFGTTFKTEGYEKSGVDNMADAAFLCLMAVDTYFEGMQSERREGP